MIRLGMSAAFFEAVLNGVQAHVVTLVATVQTLVIFLGQMFVNIAHNASSLFWVFVFQIAAALRKKPAEFAERGASPGWVQLGMEIMVAGPAGHYAGRRGRALPMLWSRLELGSA